MNSANQLSNADQAAIFRSITRPELANRSAFAERSSPTGASKITNYPRRFGMALGPNIPWVFFVIVVFLLALVAGMQTVQRAQAEERIDAEIERREEAEDGAAYERGRADGAADREESAREELAGARERIKALEQDKDDLQSELGAFEADVEAMVEYAEQQIETGRFGDAAISLGYAAAIITNSERIPADVGRRFVDALSEFARKSQESGSLEASDVSTRSSTTRP